MSHTTSTKFGKGTVSIIHSGDWSGDATVVYTNTRSGIDGRDIWKGPAQLLIEGMPFEGVALETDQRTPLAKPDVFAIRCLLRAVAVAKGAYLSSKIIAVCEEA